MPPWLVWPLVVLWKGLKLWIELAICYAFTIQMCSPYEWNGLLLWVHHSPYICDVNKFVLQLALELNKWFVLVIAKLDGIQMPPPIVETLYFEKNSSFISSTHELDHKANEFVIFYRQSYNHLFFDYVWSKVLMNYHFISWVYIEKVNMSI